MQSRIALAFGAWLLGAAAATGGSLLAVSQLGLGITSGPSQQLTVRAVNQALAGERAERLPDPPAAVPHSPAPRRTAHPSPGAHPAQPVPIASAAPATPPETLLTSSGGSVLATCEQGGAYLVSWSPGQGFEAQQVLRGPSTEAIVRFESPSDAITMRVTCRSGTPTPSVSGWNGGGEDDHGDS